MEELQSASQYEDRTSEAIYSVLVEIGQTLGSYRGMYAVVGGAVPWLLLRNSEMQHVGTADVDLSLDAEALAKDDQYADLVEMLVAQGYHHVPGRKSFQLVRTIPTDDGGGPITVVVDFLRPFEAEIEKHRPPLTTDFATQRAFGADLATRYAELTVIDGKMPNGGVSRVEIAVASIPALLAMKGFAVVGRDKPKDAYDIYFSIRNYPGGVLALADACRPLLTEKSAVEGYGKVAEKFRSFEDYGPTAVRRFVEGSDILDGRTPDEWQQDAFGQVQAWLEALGLTARSA